jgi:endonuclease-8
MDERLVEHRPGVATLGPDLLGDFDAEEALRRLRLPEHAELSLAEALLDQRILAGVGNVYKSESLFVARLNPFSQVQQVDDAGLRALLESAERLMRANAEAPIRTTTSGRGPRLWVYGRTGRPCLRCRTPIASRPQGEQARRTYWCPRCQPA